MLNLVLCVFFATALSISDSSDFNGSLQIANRHLRERHSEQDVSEETPKEHSSKKKRKKKKKRVRVQEEESDVSEQTTKKTKQSYISQDIQKEKIVTTENPLEESGEDKEPPSLDIRVKEQLVNEINFYLLVSIPSTVWCKVVTNDEPIPSIESLKQEASYSVESRHVLHYENLQFSKNYRLTCYAESLSGVPMEDSLENTSVEFQTNPNSASFVIPAISAERVGNKVAVRLLSAPSKPTICMLSLLSNEIIDRIPIDLLQWNRTHFFHKIDIYSEYKVNCGLGDFVSLQSSDFDFYTATQFIEATSKPMTWLIAKISLIIGCICIGVFVVVKVISRRGEEEVKEAQPEEEQLLKDGLPQLSTETSAILNSLQPTSWRCSICQYLNNETVTECVMCHSAKNEPQFDSVDDEESDDGFSDDFDMEATNSFSAQAVVPKEPPRIVKVNEESEESEEEVPIVVEPVKPKEPEKVEIPIPKIDETPKKAIEKPVVKPAPMKLRAGSGNAKGVVIKKTAGSSTASAAKVRAKPVVIKVAKNNDLFSELGMNAEVKETKRITRIPRIPRKEETPVKEIDLDSDNISSDGWGNKEDDLDFSDSSVCSQTIHKQVWT